MDQTVIREIASHIEKTNDFHVIQPIRIGELELENELLLFAKPELFMVADLKYVEQSLGLIFRKIREFGAVVSGIMIVGGGVLDKLSIMDRHYGYINQLSRNASRLITHEDLLKISETLKLSSVDGYKVFGGHEHLAYFPDEDPFVLDQMWYSKKSFKLRSGFYFQSYEHRREKLILVNGFHPAQLYHFTDPTHRIVLVLLQSANKWQVLRDQMVGLTYPESADPNSIRGTLYRNQEEYGLNDVTIAYNGVHLSAGPFEALFELNNFFGKILGLDLTSTPPSLLKKMMESDITIQNALETLKNPQIVNGGKPSDLFTATENMDSSQAVEVWKENIQ